jgi:ABC-2 type transport system permease protein
MRLIRIFIATITRSAQRELSHRANSVFEAMLAAINTIAGIATIAVLFTQTESLAGWRRESVIVLLGTFQIMTGLLWAFVEPNVAWFAGKVNGGELDDVLLQPVPSLFTVSLGGCNPWALLTLFTGIVVTVTGVVAMSVQLTVLNVLAFGVLLGAGAVLMWASRVLVASLAFWVQGFEPDVLYGALWQMGRYPSSVYHPIVQRVLFTAVPVALITGAPAQALTKGVDAMTVLLTVFAAIAGVLIVSTVWRLGLRRYSSATS